MTIWCYNCDTAATKLTANGTALCATCAEAYQLGQCEPETAVGDVADPLYREVYFQRHPEDEEDDAPTNAPSGRT